MKERIELYFLIFMFHKSRNNLKKMDFLGTLSENSQKIFMRIGFIIECGMETMERPLFSDSIRVRL